MKRPILTLISIALLCFSTIAQNSTEAPKIVSTNPIFGDCNVNPDLKEIVITFNQEMQEGMSVIDSRNMPEISDKPYWKDKKTFIIPVNLASDRMYDLIFNNQKFNNFRNLHGIPLQPDQLIFKTPTLDYKKLNAKAYEELFTYFPTYYSYSELRGISWKQEFEKRKKEFMNSNSNIEFAINLLSVLKQANDPHMFIEVSGVRYYSGTKRITDPNYIRANSIFKMLDDKKFTNDFQFVGGRIGEVGYISIKSWNFDIENLKVNCWGSPDSIITMQEFLKELSSLNNIIIDVRENSGGNETYAKQFASFFITDTIAYEKIVLRDSISNKFTIEKEKYIYPNEKSLKYNGNIYVLSGSDVMSSNESFLLMMRQLDNVKIAGMTSYGSSGNPIPVKLSNQIEIYIPSWKAYTLDGKLIEGNGISPDIEIVSSENNEITKDSWNKEQEDKLISKIIEITKTK